MGWGSTCLKSQHLGIQRQRRIREVQGQFVLYGELQANPGYIVRICSPKVFFEDKRQTIWSLGS